MMELVDEADLGAADARALGIRELRRRDLVDIDLAGIRVLEQPGDMQERGFAGPGRRHQGNRLPRPDRELRPFEDFQHHVALAVMPIDPMQKEDGRILRARLDGALSLGFAVDRGVTHSATPRPDRGAPRARPDRASPTGRAQAPSPPPPWSRRHRDRRGASRENTIRARTVRYSSARRGSGVSI